MHDNGSPDPAALDADSAGHDRLDPHVASGGVPRRSPGRALLAVTVSVVLIGLLWTARGAGPLALILIPLLVIYVANVYLGGGLNESPLAGIDRIRRLLGPQR